MTNSNENDFIKLPNDIYDNMDITNEELTVLALMYRNYQLYKNIGVCSIEMIVKIMRFNTQKNHDIVPTIKEAIFGLLEKKFIVKILNIYKEEITVDDIKKDTLFYVELVKPLDEYYFKVYDRDLDHIFKQLESDKTSKFNIVRYFIACCRVSNNDSQFGYLSQGKLKQLLNDSKTIHKYNIILQDELHLIRYNNNFLTPERRYCTTFIGKYDDEKNFNLQLQIEVSAKNLVHTDKIVSNKRRSKKQEINNIANDVSKVSELEKKQEQYKELEYKPNDNIIDNRTSAEIKGRGLQNNKKKVIVEDTVVDKVVNVNNEFKPDIFEDWFDDNECDNNKLTDEEYQAKLECEVANDNQIPDDVKRIIQQMQEDISDDDFYDLLG